MSANPPRHFNRVVPPNHTNVSKRPLPQPKVPKWAKLGNRSPKKWGKRPPKKMYMMNKNRALPTPKQRPKHAKSPRVPKKFNGKRHPKFALKRPKTPKQFQRHFENYSRPLPQPKRATAMRRVNSSGKLAYNRNKLIVKRSITSKFTRDDMSGVTVPLPSHKKANRPKPPKKGRHFAIGGRRRSLSSDKETMSADCVPKRLPSLMQNDRATRSNTSSTLPVKKLPEARPLKLSRSYNNVADSEVIRSSSAPTSPVPKRPVIPKRPLKKPGPISSRIAIGGRAGGGSAPSSPFATAVAKRQHPEAIGEGGEGGEEEQKWQKGVTSASGETQYLGNLDLSKLNLEAFYPRPKHSSSEKPSQGNQRKHLGLGSGIRARLKKKKDRKKKSATPAMHMANDIADAIAHNGTGAATASSNTSMHSSQDKEDDSALKEANWLSGPDDERIPWPETSNQVTAEARAMLGTECISKGWHLELGTPGAPTNPELDFLFPKDDVAYFSENLLGMPHVNYLGEDPDMASKRACLTVEVEPFIHKGKVKKYRAIIKTKRSAQRIIFDSNKDHIKLLKSLNPSLAKYVFKQIRDTQLSIDLASFEKKEIMIKYKFGILYAKEGQTEDEMFSNCQQSPDFTEFLEFIGKKISLQGWSDYAGGLDTKTGSTGESSVYWKVKDYEVMFHVSTMLPYQEKDLQRVERKRHIGNDVVVIIFKEGKTPFNPLCLRNQFNHIVCIVEKVPNMPSTHYRIVIADKAGVASYAPVMPNPPIFEKNTASRDFILTKLINGERKSLRSPEFKSKMVRTASEFLSVMIKKYYPRK